MILKKRVQDFFKNHWNKKDPVLLGLSGGPDSKALFHLLLELKIPFSAAHVNHGWRKESSQEAEALELLCKKNNINFYVKNLSMKLGSNLEDRARNERFAFFKEIILEKGYSALLLAHHGDDLAETVLKRIFEGANIENLSGPQQVSQKEGISIWRPLLEIQKKEILDWLAEKKIDYFLDSTNNDDCFLRARMRKSLLPLLSEHFGKNVVPALMRMGRNAGEFSEFLDKHTKPYRDENPVLNFSKIASLSSFEAKLILRDFLERQGITASHPQIEAIYLHLKRKSAHKKLIIGKKEAHLNKGTLALYDHCRVSSRKVHRPQ